MVVTLVSGAALHVGSAAAQTAQARQGEVIASLTDDRHDVRIFPQVRGLSTQQRNSIDIFSIEVQRRDTTTRFIVRLRHLVRTRDWDQMVFLNFTPPASSTDDWSGSLGMSPQVSGASYATFFQDQSGTNYESCDPLRARVEWQRNTISLDVPRRCLPDGEAKVTAESLTGYFRSDIGGPWSRDRARFPTPIILR